MRWFIYKAPRKKGDKPLETHKAEISQSLLELKAVRLGPITVVSEEELRNEGEIV